MMLADLIEPLRPDVLEVRGDVAADIADIAYDSRAVRPGCLFVAVEGFKQDGHRFVEAAARAGAAAVVVRKPPESDLGVPVVQVRDTRRALALCSAAFHGFPGRHMAMVGVTGTNGKTTTTILIEGILEAAGRKPGLLGTMCNRIGGVAIEAKNTTPESLDLQRMLAEMRAAGHDSAVMEVSSHGLTLERVTGCAFDVGVFTNLTQDHLDFHADLEDYFLAKRRLFESLGVDNPKSEPRGAVVNADDPRCAAIRAVTAVPFWTYGIRNPADVRATAIRHTQWGAAFHLTTSRGEADVQLRLSGLFNVYNALAALGAALAMEVPFDTAVAALQAAAPVRGRFETVDEGQPFRVIVDYAHTPDGLENILRAAREITPGRVIVVFGCGGDRDASKRPKMGTLALELADRAIATSDNPRTEDPQAILAQIVDAREGIAVIADRREAIVAGCSAAEPGDTVVIAGKGHETYQEIMGVRHAFDDVEEARAALRGSDAQSHSEARRR